MAFGIFSDVRIVLCVVCILFMVSIKEVHPSLGDTCTPTDDSNCTFPGLTCTAVGRCDCYLGRLKDGPSPNDTECDQRILGVPLVSTIVTPTTVTFNWEGQSQEDGPQEYNLVWRPQTGKIQYVYPVGGQVSGLLPDHHYNFTIVTTLSEEFMGGGKFFTEVMPECTTSPYGGECSTCRRCDDPQLFCNPDMNNTLRCICGDLYFNSTDNGNCTSLDALMVVNITSSATPTEITLHWATTRHLSDVTYIVDRSPDVGEISEVTDKGAKLTALNPGVSYQISVTSVLPADAFYHRKISTSDVYTVMTKYPHLGECFGDLNNDCQDTTSCIRANNGTFRCMCGPTEYFSDTAGVCSTLEDLMVEDVKKKVTSYTVGLTWSNKVIYAAVNYTLEWTPRDGTLDNISRTGAHVSGLNTDTMYNFMITSSLPADVYYPEKNISVQVNSVRTDNDLRVTLISAPVTATSVTFTWIGSSLGGDVNYNFIWTPRDGQIDFANASGGQVSGLRPDSEYSFTIVSDIYGMRTYQGPNVTICTDSFYGGQCSMCGTCENEQDVCIEADDSIERCLCSKTTFNLTDTGNCTALSLLVVMNITTTTSTTTANISWVAGLNLSSVTYRVNFDHPGEQVDWVTSTGAHVSGLSPGTIYYLSIESDLPGDSYNVRNIISSPTFQFWTDAPYLGECAAKNNKECQEKTECILANDQHFHCMCSTGYYFNQKGGTCSRMDDLKVTGVSTTSSATTVTLAWLPGQAPPSAIYTLAWIPNDGVMDSFSPTGATMSGLKSNTDYTFTVTTHLPRDDYYPDRNVSVQVSPVKTKPSYNETCDVMVGCQSYQSCLPVSGSHKCLCYATDEYYNDKTQQCIQISNLEIAVLSTITSATGVTFTWMEVGPISGEGYSLDWTPRDGEAIYVDGRGGQVEGLKPDTQYKFTIVTNFSADAISPLKTHYGPNITVCTKSLYGGECLACGSCQEDHQGCVKSLDNNTRCLCGDSFFNLTDTGNCTSLNKLIVTNITTSRTTTTANISWAANLQVSSESYTLNIYPDEDHDTIVTSAWAYLWNLRENAFYYVFVEVDVPGDKYQNGKSANSSEFGFYTDVPHFGYCDPRTNQECQELTVCQLDQQDAFRCLCNSTSYFNSTLKHCSSLDDLKVGDVSAATTATTATLTWPDKQLPATGKLNLEWKPNEGKLDNISVTGALVSGLSADTLYNFSVISFLPTDHYYPDKSIYVQVSVKTKSLFGEPCVTNDTCDGDHQDCAMALDNVRRCLCVDSFFNFTDDGNCTAVSDLMVTNITINASTTSIDVTWVPGLQLSSVKYTIQLYPSVGQVASVTRTGGRVVGLSPGTYHYFSVDSSFPGDVYKKGQTVFSPEQSFYTDVLYLGYCDPDTSKECQEKTKCIRSVDELYYCLCDSSSYFNVSKGACSSLNDLKVTDVTIKTTATTVTFTWPDKQLPVNLSFAVEWTPAGGHLDNVSRTGAHVSGLTAGAVYNFTIISTLAADQYYPQKNVSAEISSVTIKEYYSVSIISTNVSATTVTFVWVEDSPLSDIMYSFVWTPKDGSTDYVSRTSGRVSGLHPDTKYNFSIISKLSLDSLDSSNVYVGPNVTICTRSLFGGECSTCVACQDEQQDCVMALDKKARCLCDDSLFNLTETGNCTPMDELVVTNLTVTTTTTSATATWHINLHLSYVTYEIQVLPEGGHYIIANSTGAQVFNMLPGSHYSVYVESVLPQNRFENGQNVSSSEVAFWTDVPYLGLCPPTSRKECQDKTECNTTKNGNYRCLCSSQRYYNSFSQACSSLDDLKVTNISTTTTSTTVTFTWPEKRLPVNATLTLDWTPKEGRLDNISSDGAHVSGLVSGTVYNFTFISSLPSDAYYTEKTVSVELYSVIIKAKQPNNAEPNVGLSDGDRVGIGTGCVVFIMSVAVLTVVVYKRRIRMAERLQEFSDQEYIAREEHNDGFHEGSPSKETAGPSSSSRPAHPKKASQKPDYDLTMESLPQRPQEPNSIENREVEVDSFDTRDTSSLFLSAL